VAAVTLVVGDEEFLVARAVRAAVQVVAGDVPDDGSVHDVLAAEITPAELAELVSPSLFGESRVVVVRAAQEAGKDLIAALLTLAGDGDDDVALVVVHSGGVKGKALVDGLKHAGANVVDVPRMKTGRDREQFVIDEVRAVGGHIDLDAAAELIAAVGTDLRELSIACVQLVADLGPRVTSEHIAAHHRGRAESTGYTVADRAVEGDVASALESLRWALSTGVDPVLVSSALAANLRTIALVGGAGRGSPDALAGSLGMPPWKVRRAQAWLRRWRPDALADAVQAVAVADADIKGAGDDAVYAAERAVIAVATCAAR
jgi:DNA polymerase-3 subunit delta